MCLFCLFGILIGYIMATENLVLTNLKKMKTLNTTVKAVLLSFVFACTQANAQTVYDNNYDTLYFGGNISTFSNYPSGSNGTAEGDVVLYENVTVLDGDTIDCYIITQSVSSGVNISSFDKEATSGASGSIIEDRFFCASDDISFRIICWSWWRS